MDGQENENDMDEDGNLDLSGDENMNNNEINQSSKSFRMFLSDCERQRRMTSIRFVCYLVQYILILWVYFISLTMLMTSSKIVVKKVK